MKIKNRIKSRQDFQETIRKGQCIKNAEYIVYYLKNNLGYSRVGVSAPTKVGNAVKRNRIRRQIKAMLNQIVDLNTSIDLIVVSRKNYKIEENHEHNKSSLEKLIKSIGE